MHVSAASYELYAYEEKSNLFLTILREGADIGWPKAGHGNGSRNEGTRTTTKKAPAWCSWTDLGLVHRWTPEEYRRERASLMNTDRFWALTENSQNFLIQDQIFFVRDTALKERLPRWAVFSRWYVGLLVNTCFAGMRFVRCEQNLSYSRQLWDNIDAGVRVSGRDLELRRSILSSRHAFRVQTKPGGSSHVLRFHDARVSNAFDVFEESVQPHNYLLCGTAITKFLIMAVNYFLRYAECEEAVFSFSQWLQVLTNVGLYVWLEESIGCYHERCVQIFYNAGFKHQ